MTTSRLRLSAALAAVASSALLVTACGNTNDKAADSKATSADAAAGATADLAKLDVGKYPTSPRPPFGKPGEGMAILDYDSQRMSEYVLAPFEIDPTLTDRNILTGPISGPASLARIYGKEVSEVPANQAEMYGFVSGASNGKPKGSSRDLQNMVTRYLTPEDAQKAVEQMADEAAASKDSAAAEALPGLPDTRVVTQDYPDGNKVLMAWTPVIKTKYQAYVLYQWISVPPKDADELPTLAEKAITKQIPLIKQFPSIGLKVEQEETGVKRHNSMMDVQKVLIYTLPYSDAELTEMGATGSHARAVYGPRGMAHNSTSPDQDFALLTEVGATANGVERSTVYRAATPDGAKKIVDTFSTFQKAHGGTAIDAPKGVSDTSCFKVAREDSGDSFTCYIRNGRYVGEVFSDSLTDVSQQASAQYAILTKADQNAK